MILKNHAIAPIRKERLIPSSKAWREASRNEFVEKGGMPDRAEDLRGVDRGKNCLQAGLACVKPIRNRLRKIKNLIKIQE